MLNTHVFVFDWIRFLLLNLANSLLCSTYIVSACCYFYLSMVPGTWVILNNRDLGPFWVPVVLCCLIIMSLFWGDQYTELNCMNPDHKGPSIYDVHTEGGGGKAEVDACGRGMRGEVSPMWTSTQKIKIRVH